MDVRTNQQRVRTDHHDGGFNYFRGGDRAASGDSACWADRRMVDFVLSTLTAGYVRYRRQLSVVSPNPPETLMRASLKLHSLESTPRLPTTTSDATITQRS